MIELTISTPSREALVDITTRVQSALQRLDTRHAGAVAVFVPHTTAAVTINEGADPSVARDIVDGLARVAPRDAGYRHGEGNADAHLKTSMIGSHVLVPCSHGRLHLGTWQSIFLAEFDGPRTRKVWVTTLAAPHHP